MAVLEQGLSNVLKKLESVLSDKELVKKNYNSLLEQTLNDEGIISLDKTKLPLQEINLYGSICYSIESRLNIQSSYGVFHDYFFLEKTSLSQEAKKDIELFEKIVNTGMERLKPQVEHNSYEQKDYNALVNKVSESLLKEYNLTDLSSDRKITFSAVINARTEAKYNVEINRFPSSKNEMTKFGITKEQLQNLIKTVEY